VAGGLAAIFALNRSPAPVEQAATKVEVVKTKVLVASQTIGVGERIQPTMFEWQEWPENALRPEFITEQTLPDAPQQLTNAVARFEIFVGDPIRLAKLVQTNSGYLSAVISPGMRGVSVPLTAETAAGGFIVPNDRVDVIVTRRTQYGEVSETILTNVRVIAIGRRIGEQGDTGQAPSEEEGFDKKTIATLELSPSQAETLVNGQRAGEVSLTLRSIADFAENGARDAIGKNSTVQIIRAGKVVSTKFSISDTEQDTSQGTSQLPMPQLIAAGVKGEEQVNGTQQSDNVNSSADDQSAPPPLE
jgi:pilus assembly protein CpaB